MSIPSPPVPAKLVIGILLQEQSPAAAVIAAMEAEFGSLDIVSRWFAFDYTRYYDEEMGSGLKRRMMSFERLIQQDDLPDIKRFTNDIENRYAISGARRVNIDPGYLVPERFVLATGKNFTHRVYLAKGIYADLTLIFSKGRFQTLPWTYPDYADGDIQRFLMKVREKYKVDVKRAGYGV
ncbi:MAG: DUF4416 family protein [Desulfobacterales bacterium]